MFPLLTLWKKVSIPRNGLVAEYLFSNNYLDTSDSGFDGINNGTSFINDKKGNPNSAIDFNGTSNYVDIDALLTEMLSQSAGTVNMWVKFDLSATTDFVFMVSDFSTGNHSGLAFIYNNWEPSKLVAGFEWNSSATDITSRLYADIDLRDDTWHMVTWTSSGSFNKIYIDAVNISLSFQSGTNVGGWFDNIDVSVDRLSLGALVRSSGNGFFHNGGMDNVRAYNRELSQQEINSLKNELT